jgi:dephospho-CoA kinase
MIIAIIGSPLAGKTHLLKELSNRGIKVFSADTYVKQIYQVGQPGYIVIKEELGEEFVNDEGVDKKRLAI